MSILQQLALVPYMYTIGLIPGCVLIDGLQFKRVVEYRGAGRVNIYH